MIQLPTEPEVERLTILSEECAEVIHAVSKVLRFGFESHYPNGGPTNREKLEEELGHVNTLVEVLQQRGEIRSAKVEISTIRKWRTMWKYTRCQDYWEKLR